MCRATIVARQGSTPRSLGTSFLVLEGGGIWGTIGGGLLEAQVIEAAGQSLRLGRADLLDFHLSSADAAQNEMICGGRLQIYLEPLLPTDPMARAFWQLASQAAIQSAQIGRALMASRLRPGPAEGQAIDKFLWQDGRLLWPQAGQALGGPPEGLINEFKALSNKGKPWLWTGPAGSAEREYYFFEPIFNQPVVYICGGGHISLCLAPLVKMVGFSVVVIDDRPEYADPRRFVMANRVLVRDFNRVFDGLALDDQSYLVIVTRGHLHDKEVLAQSLNQPAAYVGMIGSNRKRQLIYQALEEEGFGPERLKAVHSPIGLAIGAETPEEVAISIVAELIAVRSSLSTGTTTPADRS
ncbi:xanthine dehydrogenase accessory factor [Desulfarculales bacterium]